jgi:hypothetical protein
MPWRQRAPHEAMKCISISGGETADHWPALGLDQSRQGPFNYSQNLASPLCHLSPQLPIKKRKLQKGIL